IRTEFVPALQRLLAGTAVGLIQNRRPLSALGTDEDSLTDIIQEPANRFGIVLEPGLLRQIKADFVGADALPLLAYALKALYDREGGNHRLTLQGYQDLGGLQEPIGRRLQLVLSHAEPTKEEERALKRAFTRHLICVDEGAVEGPRRMGHAEQRAKLPQR